jgi:hypothetical protein
MSLAVQRSASQAVKSRRSRRGTGRSPPLRRLNPPQLSQPVEKIRRGPQWLDEIKLDGFRMAERIDHGRAQLLTRTGIDWTDKYPMRPSGAAFWPGRRSKPKWSGSTPLPSTSPPTLGNGLAIISPRTLKRRGTKPSALRLPSRRRPDNASSTHLTIADRANRRLLRYTYSSVRYGGRI